ncbi:MAG: hypothetical protein KF880_01750 [Ferruginibacter sp.]|nr:hypothetical protein [Ferruginibacter sp.]
MTFQHIFNIQQEPLTARIVPETGRIQQLFRVMFSNGYENIFFKDVESGRWVEEDLGFTELAAQVGMAALPFSKQPIHVPKMLLWHHEDYMGHYVKFGFYAYTKGEQRLYEVYHHNKKYLYTLVLNETGDWQVMDARSTKIPYLDQAFLDAVVHILPQYEEDYH